MRPSALLVIHRVLRSQDGTTCWGFTPDLEPIDDLHGGGIDDVDLVRLDIGHVHARQRSATAGSSVASAVRFAGSTTGGIPATVSTPGDGVAPVRARGRSGRVRWRSRPGRRRARARDKSLRAGCGRSGERFTVASHGTAFGGFDQAKAAGPLGGPPLRSLKNDTAGMPAGQALGPGRPGPGHVLPTRVSSVTSRFGGMPRRVKRTTSPGSRPSSSFTSRTRKPMVIGIM